MVVTTKMSNLALRNYLDENNINYLLSDVGDRYVIEMMKKTTALSEENNQDISFFLKIHFVEMEYIQL